MGLCYLLSERRHEINPLERRRYDAEEILWRAVHPSQYIHDPALGRSRPSSDVFRNNGTSLYVASGSVWEDFLNHFIGMHVVSVTVGQVLSAGSEITRTLADPPLTHCEHVEMTWRNKPKSGSRALAMIAIPVRLIAL